MKMSDLTQRSSRFALVFTLAILCTLTLAACAPAPVATPTSALPTESAQRISWSALMQRTPFPYLTPLPPPNSTPLDGIYVKFENEGTPVPCRRCPDFKPEGGLWKLGLDKGIYRVFYPAKPWRSVGSFTVAGDRIAFFNDPFCTEDVGVYTWKLENNQLIFTVVADACSTNLRAKNFTKIPWNSCQPPTRETAVTGHWKIPEGCD
jgi:hypothetical protein